MKVQSILSQTLPVLFFEKKIIMNKDKESVGTIKNSFVETSQQASAENEEIGEGEIKKYDVINPEHKAFEDIDEIQSTDDV